MKTKGYLLTLCFMLLLWLPLGGSFAASLTTVEINVGQSIEIKPFMVDAGVLKSGTPQWKSQNDKIATVSSAGKVTGLAEGSTVISATVNQADGIKEARILLVVKSMVASVSIDQASVKLAVGQNATLKATIVPKVAGKAPLLDGVVWKSQNENIVKVDSTGVLTGTGRGKAIVYAATKDGDKRAYVDVEVVSMVTGIAVSPSSLKLKLGETQQLIPTVTPESALFKGVIYKSDNANIAAVDANGFVTTKGLGTTIITVQTMDGGLKYGVSVTVESMVASVSLDKTYVELDSVKKTEQLRAILTPKDPNRAPIVSEVKWTSSNTSVATVSSTGLVTGLKPGIASITATSLDGSYEAYCTIKSSVPIAASQSIPVSKIEFVDPPKVVYTGQVIELGYKLYPDNATERSVTVRADLATANTSLTGDSKFLFKPTTPAFYQLTLTSGEATAVTTVEVRQALSSVKIKADKLDAFNGGYVTYLGHTAEMNVDYQLSQLAEKDFKNPDVKWLYNTAELKVETLPNEPFRVNVTLLKPMNTYLEVSLLGGTIKYRINLFYESAAKDMEVLDQASINLGYAFTPQVTMRPKDKLRYGLTAVPSKDFSLMVEEAYISTTLLKSEVAFEEGYIKELKAKADTAPTDSERDSYLSLWGKHSLRKFQYESMITSPSESFQRIKDMSLLTDRSLKPLAFFTVKDMTIASDFNGKALIKLISKDGSLERKMWVTAQAQSEDLILMDESGKVIATSSTMALANLEAQEKALKEAAEKARVAGLKARLPKMAEADMPSVGQLESVVKLYEKGVLSQGLMKKMTANVTRAEAAELLVKAYEKLTGKTVKKIPQNYYTDTQSEYVNKAYSLGLMGSLPKDRKFKPNGTITTAELSQMLVKLSSISKGKVDAKLVASIASWGKTSKGIVTKEQMAEWLAKMLP